MGLSITAGRTWVVGESVTAAKLNADNTGASVDYSTYQDSAGGALTASNGDFIWVGESSAISLPASPSDNDVVVVAQIDGDLSTTSASVSGNGNNIDYNSVSGVAADATLTLNDNFIGNLTFTFNTSNGVWKIT